MAKQNDAPIHKQEKHKNNQKCYLQFFINKNTCRNEQLQVAYSLKQKLFSISTPLPSFRTCALNRCFATQLFIALCFTWNLSEMKIFSSNTFKYCIYYAVHKIALNILLGIALIDLPSKTSVIDILLALVKPFGASENKRQRNDFHIQLSSLFWTI